MASRNPARSIRLSILLILSVMLLTLAVTHPADIFAADGAWSALPSAPVTGGNQSAICDPVGKQMIVFGSWHVVNGTFGNSTWSLSLSGAPAWTQLFPTGLAPSARGQHSAVLDSRRQRMLVFGGIGTSGMLNDVWELSLSGPLAWHRLTPGGNPPSPRSRHVAIYDPARDRMIVFGGANTAGTALQETWELDLGSLPPTWTQLSPAGGVPAGRTSAAAIYDPVRNQMVVFSGLSTAPLNEVWALDLDGGTQWSQVVTIGGPPSARWASTALYDPDLDRMLIFAGRAVMPFGPPRDVNDVWALSLVNTVWSQLVPTGTIPAERRAHVAVVDPPNHRMVIYGGEVGGLGYSHVADAAELRWEADPTAVLVSLLSAEATPARVRLTWRTFDAISATVLRRTPETEWSAVAERVPDAGAGVSYEDRDITPGGRYAYRLALRGDSGRRFSEEVWLDVPLRPTLRLEGLRPNPAAGEVFVSLVIGEVGLARIELLDLTGRSVAARSLDLDPGRHLIRIAQGTELPPGIYFVRVIQGAEQRLHHGTVLR